MLAFVGFLLLSKDAIFILSHFFLTTSTLHRTLHLALDLIIMLSVAASICAVTKFSNLSLEACVSDISRRVLNLCLTVIYC